MHELTAAYNSENEIVPITIMPEISGESLAEYDCFSEKTLTHEQIFAVLGQIAGALDYMHSKNLYHRDVKPENIFLRKAEDSDTIDAVLIDFGSVKGNIGHDSRPREPGGITVAFSSPEALSEMIGDKSVQVGPGADQYSLALTALDLLGRNPAKFINDRPKNSISDSSTNNLDEMLPDYSEQVQSIFTKALSYFPESRYQSCQSFIGDLVDAMRRDIDSEYPSDQINGVAHFEKTQPIIRSVKNDRISRYMQKPLRSLPELVESSK